MLLLTAAFSSHAESAEVKVGVGKSGQATIWITGEIVAGDADKFSQSIRQANDSGKFVANVRLDSPGGNLLEGVKIADAIRFGKTSTNVGKTAVCASACFLMFAAGATKNASYGAQIGVHGASGENGEETAASGAATVSMAKIAKELGVPSAIIGRMVVTSPQDMVWLSPQELQSMGVTMMGRPSQAGPPVANLQQTPPNAPLSLSPSEAGATASRTSRPDAPPTWGEIVNRAMERSASQNNGKPLFSRSCQPELRVCNVGLSYVDNQGKVAFLKIVEDMNGKIIVREACTLNDFKDVRTCINWDNGTSHRDMKGSDGSWTKVADE
ncbi:ATP-dependent Clp protease proteolytic subunit [Bradyrhizobium sp. DASA03068]|uniref:ATP-dependent Clp protease proteolytic subunit n=1 Tax=Bradyrhizobium sp. BLXBL-01 TaxID=3395915 RepID=UPI003F706A0A